MKALFKSLFALILSLLAITSLAACDGGELSAGSDVSFYVDGALYGNVNGADTVSLTHTVSPRKEGYAFDGWFIDEGVWSIPLTYDYLTENIGSPITAYAKWRLPEEEHVHTFSESFIVTDDDHAHPSSCGHIDEVSERSPHVYRDVNVIVEPTENENGLKTVMCEGCRHVKSVSIPMLSHTHTLTRVKKTEQTCTENGISEHYKCTECNAVFLDEGAAVVIDPEALIIPASHKLSFVESRAPGCTEQGNIEHYICKSCAKLFLDESGSTQALESEVIIPATHTVSFVEKKNATCTEDGYIEHYRCKGCDEVFLDAEAKMPLDESYIILASHTLQHVSETMADCTHNGNLAHYFCNSCDGYFLDANAEVRINAQDVVIVGSHDLAFVPKLTPSCTENGNHAYYYCNACNGYFLDAKAQTPTDKLSTVIAASHKLSFVSKVASGCFTTGNIDHYHCAECDGYFLDSQAITPLDKSDVYTKASHSLTNIPAVKATCSAGGNIEYFVCSECSSLFLDKNAEFPTTANAVIIPPTHKTVLVEASKPTCDTSGNVKHYLCTECNLAFSDAAARYPMSTEEIVIAPRHQLRRVPEVEATCDSDGVMTHFKCSECLKLFATSSAEESVSYEQLVIKGGHEITHVPYNPATCEINGNVEHYFCQRCYTYSLDESFNETVSYFDTVIVASHEITCFSPKDPTCTEDGSLAYSYCDVCQQYFISDSNGDYIPTDPLPLKIPSLGHILTYYPEVGPTCAYGGSLEHWDCERCKLTFADSSCKTVVNSATDLMTDHTFSGRVCTACGDKKASEGLEFGLSDDGTYYRLISRGSCTDYDVVIPPYYNGLPVKSIAPLAFDQDSRLVSITLPETLEILEYIDYGLFMVYAVEAYNLVEVCNKSKIELSPTTEFKYWEEESTLEYNVKNIYRPGEGESIITEDENGFVFCFDGQKAELLLHRNAELENVVLPQYYNGKCYEVARYAFYNLSDLKHVVISEGVTRINDLCFADSRSIMTVTLPSTLTEVSISAFSCSYRIVEVYNNSSFSLSPGDEETCGGVAAYALRVYNDPQAARDSEFIDGGDGYLFYRCGEDYYLIDYEGSTEILTLPEYFNSKVYSVYDYAFYNVDGIKSVTIPDTVIDLGDAAFIGCPIESIYVGRGIKVISKSVFSGCKNLVSVNLPEGLTDILDHAFEGCESLTAITIPQSVWYIGRSFAYCTNLSSVNFVEGSRLEHLGDYCFQEDISLTEIVIPASIIRLGQNLFYECKNLVSVTLLSIDSLESFNATEIFYGCTSMRYNEDDFAYYIGTKDNPYAVLCLAKNKDVTEVTFNESTRIICDSAFLNCSITDIILPEGVEIIGASAFWGCSAAKTVVIPSSVICVGHYAFRDCSSLAEIYYNATYLADNEYPISAFYDSTSANGELSLYVGENVLYIPYAFFASSRISHIDFSRATSLKTIGKNAFSYCTMLSKLVISDNITEIGEMAFKGCTSLGSITLGSSLTVLGPQAFWETENLTEIIYKPTSLEPNKYHDFGGWFGSAGTLDDGITVYITKNVLRIPAYCFNDFVAPKIIDFIIEEGSELIEIGEDAFGDLLHLRRIDLSAATKLERIDYAFGGSYNVEYIYLPSSLESLPYGTISSAALTELYLGCDVEGTNGNSPFGSISNPFKLIIGKDVKRIGSNLFSRLSFTEIIFEEGSLLEHIGYGAFSEANCAGELILPPKLKTIGPYAFSSCKFSSVTIPETVSSIGAYAFAYSNSLTELIYNAREATVEDNAFYYCADQSLGLSVTVGKCVEVFAPGSLPSETVSVIFDEGSACREIGDYAFADCTLLTSVTIPETVELIGACAFYGCSGITSISIPKNIKVIGAAAFGNMSSLTEIYYNAINATATVVEDYRRAIFVGCSKDITLTVGKDTEVFPSSLFAVQHSGYPITNIISVVFEEGSSLKAIAEYAFSGLSIKSIALPATLVEIGESAFGGCPALSSVTFAEGSQLTRIGDYAFTSCSMLTGLVIPESVEYIGAFAFSGCSALTEILIPEATVFIGMGAFYDCASLSGVTLTLKEGWCATYDGEIRLVLSIYDTSDPSAVLEKMKDYDFYDFERIADL